MHRKRMIAAVLTALCLLAAFAVPASAAGEGLDNFRTGTRSYTPGQFQDVGIAAWYTPYVSVTYELGLMQGNSIGAFCPGGNVTVAETAALAARLHKLYHHGNAMFRQGEPWYQVYVDYCEKNGILLAEYPDYNAAAGRSEFAAMLARAFPAEALAEMNSLEDNAIPDVPAGAENAAEIYLLYRAGVLTGNDDALTFAPASAIRRSEVAAIAARMARPELRKSLASETTGSYPTLTKQERAEDSFFSDAAMLGNSLVDGMMLCSGIPMDFYGGTGLTVYNNKLSNLLQKQYGKVYIEFGINEIGGAVDGFISAYRSIVERIRETMPEAEIYLMAITPVTAARSSEGVFTMKKIGSFNEAICALAAETDCWYLDSCTNLCDGTGFLPDSYGGWDGSPHLANEGYRAWGEVIRTYYAK